MATTATGTVTPLIEALRGIPEFADLKEDQLQWIAANSEDLHFAAGEVVAEAGSPADRLIVILEGELQGARRKGGAFYIVGPGTITGMLPFSRMTQFPSMIRATASTRIMAMHKDRFDEMFRRIPDIQPRLVGRLTDRVREAALADQQREKLAALGKLSAGLAHELNNPASAVRRSALGLREALATLRAANFELCREDLTDEVLEHLTEIEKEVATEMTGSPVMDALERSDREDTVTAWLEKHGVEKAWELAPALVEAEADEECLDKLSRQFPGKTMQFALRRMSATIEVEKILRQIESGSARISELVKAIKEYTYMDQAGEKEIDLHEGLESTLTMLHHDLKNGINVRREYDKSLPKIWAKGSELNQVWTNLIDNAIDALKEKADAGKGEITVRTARDGACALIDIIDNGPGVPPEVKGRIFDPFFTTKPVGEGTGLGLDTVYRIVRMHHGDVRVDSRPGETHFQVRLPIARGPMV
jgi:signal transduction histidine kinase